MKYQIDQQFIAKLNRLIKEVLTDEATYLSGRDNNLAFLHEKVFSKTTSAAFSSLEEPVKQKFRKYFYLEGSTVARTDVPFADSAEAQAFFIDNFRTQLGHATMGLARTDFVRPLIEESGQPRFLPEQEKLILAGILHPFVHALEQEQINQIQGNKQSGQPGDPSPEKNPYANLGSQILVLGQSGEFDTIITQNQLEDLLSQQNLYKQQGLPDLSIQKLMSEYLKARYPELKPKFTLDGKLISFTSNFGLTAEHSSSVSNTNGLDFKGLLQEIKSRQTRQIQYQAIIASKGNLGLSPLSFQVITSGGNPLSIDGLSIGLDQSGKNPNGLFFLVDQEGTLARFTTDLAENKLKGQADLKVSIYDDHQIDSPVSPKMTIPPADFPKLGTPLRTIYKQYQQSGEFDPVSGQPVFIKPANLNKKNDQKALPSIDPSVKDSSPLEIPFTESATLQIPKPLALGPNFKKNPAPKGDLSLPANSRIIERRVMPKIPAGKGFESNKKAALSMPPVQSGGKKSISDQKTGVRESPSVSGSTKKGISKAWIAVGSTLLPIAGTLAAGAGSIFNFQ